ALAPATGLNVGIQKNNVGNFATGVNGQYNLTVTNAGGLTTTGPITVTDVLPASLTYVSAAGTDWTCNYTSATRTVSCTNSGPLAPGASSNIVLTVTPTTTGAISNTATVAMAGDTIATDNTSTNSVTVNGPLELAVTKKVGLAASPNTAVTLVNPGASITYTITVANNSSSSVTASNLSDYVEPAINITSVSACSTSGGSGSGNNNCTITRTNNDLIGNIDLKSGATATFTVTGTVGSNATGTIPNIVQIDPPFGYADSNLANNVASANFNVNAPDLTVTKTHSGTPQPGQNVSYVLQVQNIGFGATTGSITVTDQVPAGLTYQSATGTGWTCSFTSANTTVTCTTSNAIAASSLGNPITVVTKRDSSATITNTASVSGGGDNNTTNNAASDTLLGVSQLRLVKRITAINTTSRTGFVDGPGSDDTATNWPSPTSTSLQGVVNGGAVRSGDEVEYTIYFLSDGGADAQNVVLCDLVPLNQTLVTNAYSTVTAASGGTAGATRSIAASVNSSQVSYTDLVDGDAGSFYAVGASVPVPVGGTSPQPCPAANTSANGNGAVVVNLGTLPRATAPGTPTGSYGFVRFRAKVN
ncbi:MAG TPA: hypothetical protein V6D16_17565, partial [Candidatus Obscuribacterales bacterium]